MIVRVIDYRGGISSGNVFIDIFARACVFGQLIFLVAIAVAMVDLDLWASRIDCASVSYS